MWDLEKPQVLERGMAAVTNRRPEPSVGDGIGEVVGEDGCWESLGRRDGIGEGAS